jgi:hypothetical protein
LSCPDSTHAHAGVHSSVQGLRPPTKPSQPPPTLPPFCPSRRISWISPSGGRRISLLCSWRHFRAGVIFQEHLRVFLLGCEDRLAAESSGSVEPWHPRLALKGPRSGTSRLRRAPWFGIGSGHSGSCAIPQGRHLCLSQVGSQRGWAQLGLACSQRHPASDWE